MIKILYLTTDSRIGGTERAILDIIECLDRKYFLPSICSLIGQGPLLDQAEKLGINAHSLEMKSKMDLRAVFRLSHLLRKWDIDVLHTHLVHANLVGFLASRLQPVKLFIYTNHSQKRTNIFDFFNHLIMRYFNHKVIAVANIIMESLIKKAKIAPAKICLIPNGVNLKRFKPREAGPRAFPNIAMVANLRPIKGHTYLIRAMAKVVSQYPGARLTLIGEGPLRNRLIKEASNLGIERNIDFLGFREDIAEILSSIDLFVLSSLWETAPMSLLEAMAMGKPIVATKVGGIPEIIEENESGLLVPPGKAEALAKGIMTLLSDMPKAKEMGERARLVVENRFNVEKIVKKLEKFYSV